MIVSESIHATECGDWLARALVELPIEQRVTLELTDYGGYSCEEIASIMVCPVNTVKARVFYARENLRFMRPQPAAPIASRR
jgi:RNA polymerase sigma-70 factor (ECF subfamily)